MKAPDNRTLVLVYVSLAAGCVMLGTVITFMVLLAAQYFQIDISRNLWILAIPAVLSLFLNVIFIELYLRYRRH
jgi:hypothetical protein